MISWKTRSLRWNLSSDTRFLQTTEMMPSKCHRAIGFAFAKSYAWKIRQVSLANSHMTRFLQKFFPCFSATVAAISEISTVLRTALPRAESPRSMPCQLQLLDLHFQAPKFEGQE